MLADDELATLKQQVEQQSASAQLGYFIDSLKSETAIELMPLAD
jgi:hypothetical protein